MSNENEKTGSMGDHAILPAGTAIQPDHKPGAVSRMQLVKAAWDKAPEGAGKDNALKHYQSAEKAQKAGNPAEAERELEAADRALK